MRALRNLVLRSSALALFLGALTVLWPAPAAQALIPGLTIDDFSGASPLGSRTTSGTGNGSINITGGVAKVSTPGSNDVTQTMTFTFTSNQDLTVGGSATLLQIDYAAVSSSDSGNGPKVGFSLTVTDANGETSTAFGNANIGQTVSAMAFGSQLGVHGDADLTRVKSMKFVFVPISNQGFSNSVDIDRIWTLNPNARAGQAITFDSTAPSQGAIGSTYVVSAHGGPSGNPVTFSKGAGTSPSGACSISGQTVSFLAQGTCVVAANQAGDVDTYDAAPQVTQSIQVGKLTQAISFTSSPPSPGAIGSTYTVAATGGGSGNSVTFSVDGSTTNGACTVAGSTVTFVHAGTCVIAANQTGNAGYDPAPQKTQSITVGKTAQTIAFTSTAPSPGAIGNTYTVAATGGGSGIPVTFSLGAGTTNSACSVTGTTVLFAHAGTCVIAADQIGSADFTAAPQKTQSITVGKTAQTIAFTSTPPAPAGIGGSYTVAATGGGSPNPVTFSVGAGTTNAACTVAGSTVSFVHAGTCVVAADQAEHPDFSAAAQQTQAITVDKTAQAIAFTSAVPSPAFVGTTYTVTALGGASGSAVTFSTASAACTVSGATVTFVAAGTCNVDADQPGNVDFSAAPRVTQVIAVTKVTSTVGVDITPGTTVHGQPATVSATVTPALGSADGTVQFSVDGTDLGAPVALAGGTASKALPAGLAAGNHQISAAFSPTDTTTFDTATGTDTLPVGKASTTVVPVIGPSSLRATVATTPPGAGTPTGTVSFLVEGTVVGSATVDGSGLATLDYALASGRSSTVAASYEGDANFLASSASTARNDPKISATVTGKPKESKAGWYRGTATVTFTCAPSGSPLTSECPAPVVLKGNGASQSVSRTVSAADGGIGTASVTGINIDHRKPRVKIIGVKASGRYPSAPKARCKGTDKLSGIASCKVRQHKLKGDRVRYTAIAVDKAGNKSRRSVTISLSVAHVSILGLAAHGGAYDVSLGGSYTLVVIGGPRPRYVDAAVAPQQPSGLDAYFRQDGTVNGQPRWVLGVTITTDMGHSTLWNLGVLQGGHLHVIKVRVN